MSTIGLALAGRVKGSLQRRLRSDAAQRGFVFTLSATSAAALEATLSIAENLSSFQALCRDVFLSNELMNSSTVVLQVTFSSETAFSEILDSPQSRSALVSAAQAMTTLIGVSSAYDTALTDPAFCVAAANSQTAMNTIAGSEAAFQSAITSEEMLTAMLASEVALTTIVETPSALAALLADDTVVATMLATESAMQFFKNLPSLASSVLESGPLTPNGRTFLLLIDNIAFEDDPDYFSVIGEVFTTDPENFIQSVVLEDDTRWLQMLKASADPGEEMRFEVVVNPALIDRVSYLGRRTGSTASHNSPVLVNDTVIFSGNTGIVNNGTPPEDCLFTYDIPSELKSLSEVTLIWKVVSTSNSFLRGIQLARIRAEKD